MSRHTAATGHGPAIWLLPLFWCRTAGPSGSLKCPAGCCYGWPDFYISGGRKPGHPCSTSYCAAGLPPPALPFRPSLHSGASWSPIASGASAGIARLGATVSQGLFALALPCTVPLRTSPSPGRAVIGARPTWLPPHSSCAPQGQCLCPCVYSAAWGTSSLQAGSEEVPPGRCPYDGAPPPTPPSPGSSLPK